MPPKGSKKAAKPESKPADPEPKEEVNGDTKPTSAPAENGDSKQTKSTSKKRKTTDNQSDPNKESRRSSRGAPKSQPTTLQLLSYLLSDAALQQCRPKDEAEDLATRGASTRTYSGPQPLTPFEELLSAVILSRPISHRLGLRTIRTVLNPPYSFNTPKAILDAKPEDRHQAMFDARTQHKDKTAQQIGLVAKVVSEKFSDKPDEGGMEKLRKEAGKDWDKMRDLLQSNTKGVGKTGLDIFCRRVQWLWEEVYPFVDERTARGIEKLGLPKDAEGLRKAIEDNWGKIDKKGLEGKDEKVKKRRAFVVICERATSADLEGVGEDLVASAAAS